jgi:hypothetical protein
MDVPLRPQTAFKNIRNPSITTEIPRNLHNGKPELEHSHSLERANLCKVIYVINTLQETMTPYMIRSEACDGIVG